MWKGFCREQQAEAPPTGSHRGEAVPVHFWGLWKEILPRLQPEDTRPHTHRRPPLRLPLWGSDREIIFYVLMLMFCRVATRNLRNLQTWSLTSWRTRSKSLGAVQSLPQIQSLAAILIWTHTGLNSHCHLDDRMCSPSQFFSLYLCATLTTWSLIKTEFQPWRLKRDTYSLRQRSLFTNPVCAGKFSHFFLFHGTCLSRLRWRARRNNSLSCTQSRTIAYTQSQTEFKGCPRFWILSGYMPRSLSRTETCLMLYPLSGTETFALF